MNKRWKYGLSGAAAGLVSGLFGGGGGTVLVPLLAEKVGLDPAVMASPCISTIVDATSLLIYFALASAFIPALHTM